MTRASVGLRRGALLLRGGWLPVPHCSLPVNPFGVGPAALDRLLDSGGRLAIGGIPRSPLTRGRRWAQRRAPWRLVRGCGLRLAAGGRRAGSILADGAGCGWSIHRRTADGRRRTEPRPRRPVTRRITERLILGSATSAGVRPGDPWQRLPEAINAPSTRLAALLIRPAWTATRHDRDRAGRRRGSCPCVRHRAAGAPARPPGPAARCVDGRGRAGP